jgi:hypothetical protein
MSVPKTRAELVAQGYIFQSRGQCSGRTCGATMEWWLSPAKRSCPYDAMPADDSPVMSHFATCPDGAEFKRRQGRAKQMAFLHTNKGRQ